MLLLRVFCIYVSLPSVLAWSSDELALYDLIEEVNTNFYTLFGIEKDAGMSEIKKGWRRLSLEFHPDRNSAPDASERFRQVAAIYDVLKSSELREKYNEVLEHGLPDWRMPVYYYRRVRKLSWIEALLLLVLTFSVAHYFMLWGTYFEKYLVESSRKSRRKKKESEEARMEQVLADYRPSFNDTLPPKIFYGVLWIIRSSPSFAQCLVAEWRRRKADENEDEEEEERIIVRRPVAPQPVYEYAVASDLKPVSTLDPETEKRFARENADTQILLTNSPWTLEDLVTLVKLSTEKFPSGTPHRWTEIARALRRAEADVTKMAGKLKQVKREDFAKFLQGQTSAAVVESTAAGVEEDKEEEVAIVNEWTQAEQRLFETALQQFPRGTPDRWEKIEACVPNRTREECMERFKKLTEMVRSRKNLKVHKK